MKKLTEIQIKNEINDMPFNDNIPDCILPGLDEFILEWNRQVKVIQEKNKEKLLDWGSK